MMLSDSQEFRPLNQDNNAANVSCFKIFKFWLFDQSVGDQWFTANRFRYVIFKFLIFIAMMLAALSFIALFGFSPIDYIIGLFVQWLFMKHTTVDYGYWNNCYYGFISLLLILGCIGAILTPIVTVWFIKRRIDDCRKEYKENSTIVLPV